MNNFFTWHYWKPAVIYIILGMIGIVLGYGIVYLIFR